MELDKRIMGKRPLDCVDSETAKEFIGEKTDSIENLGEMFTMLYDTLDVSREEYKVGKDGGIIVVLFSIDDCLTFELKKTIAYKAYLEKRINQEKI